MGFFVALLSSFRWALVEKSFDFICFKGVYKSAGVDTAYGSNYMLALVTGDDRVYDIAFLILE